MAQFYTDPRITYMGLREPESPLEMFSRFAQLQQMADERRYGRLREKEAMLRLQELERGMAEGGAVRQAMGRGVVTPPQIPAETETIPELRGVLGPKTQIYPPGRVPTGLPYFDKQAALAALAQPETAHLVPQVEQEFAAQDMARHKMELEQVAVIQKLDDASFKRVKEMTAHISNEIGRLLAVKPEYRQGAWPILRAQQPSQIRQSLPEQYPGDQWLEMQAAGSETAKQIVDAEEKRRTKVGTEVPFPAAVEAQKARIAKAGKTEPSVVIHTVDAEGKPITKIVPKTPGAEFAATPTTEQRNKEAARKLITPAINQLEALGGRVITAKGGWAALRQKYRGGTGAITAALKDDPEYRVYQDARMALAGNLAVAQQGARPSDADVRAIWLPLVPDIFRDTAQSAAMKWEMIRVNSGLPANAAAPGTVRMIAPDGSEADVPADQVAAAEAAGAKRKQ